MDLSLRSVATNRRRRASAAAALLALAAAALVSGPTLAAYPPWQGDSVDCYYQADASGERVLFLMIVGPPIIYADSGTQTVGWRFVVRRSRNWDVGPWKVTYRSSIEKADATTQQPAHFSVRSADVHAPNVDDKSAIRYHLTLKMMWYASDGSVANHLSHRLDTMDWMYNGHRKGHGDYCPASLDTGP